MIFASYSRVSSEKQAKDKTIDSQVFVLRDYSKVNSIDVHYEIKDDGYSGTTLERPGLDELRDLAKSGAIQGILILSTDRLSRNQTHLLILLEEFKKLNIKVIFTSQSFEDNAEGNLMLQIQGAISEYERSKILDRMRRGTIHSVRKGQVIGRNAPYGYKYCYKSKDDFARWEINHEEAKNVKLIYSWYVNDGLKCTAIIKRLNDEAIVCRGSKWWTSQIYAILKNEAYKGMAYMFKTRRTERRKTAKSKDYRKYKMGSQAKRPREEWIGVPVPSIIDDVTWYKVQKLLRENAHRASRNNTKHEYLLRSLVVCGLCGSIASGYVSNKSTYYSCGAKRNKNVKSKPHDELVQVNHKPFDEKVWLGLTQLLSIQENLKMQIGKRLESKKVISSLTQTDSKIDKELESLTIQEKRIVDAYREEVISLEELKIQREKISNRRMVLETQITTAKSPVNDVRKPKITMAMLGDVSSRFQRIMTNADFKTREKIINSVVNSVILTTQKAIVRGNIPIDNLDVLATRQQNICLFF